MKRSRVLFGFGLTASGLAFADLKSPYSNIHSYLTPLIFQKYIDDAEEAHHWAVYLLRNFSFFLPWSMPAHDNLKLKIWGTEFSHPIGLAAGFDKDAEAIDGLLSLGFEYVEVGSVTPQPQPGNERPRVFRLESDEAIINRYGFNSSGHWEVAGRLSRRFHRSLTNGYIGVNLGKNKSSEDAVSDYVKGIHVLGKYANYLVINVSSPNTKGLRDLQEFSKLDTLLSQAVKKRNSLLADDMYTKTKRLPPLLLKIAPDLSDDQLQDICTLALKHKLDGIIVSNTTITRPKSLTSSKSTISEEGGLSGKPLKSLSDMVLRKVYVMTQGQIPLIGVGGVSSGQDAYDKIRNGASLVQLYSSLIYKGPTIVNQIKRDLADLLRKDGFKSIEQAIGANINKN